MTFHRYERLLDTEAPHEPFVRAALGALETDFREMALLALDDWAKCGIVGTELFSAVASLQRPSWGTWNGLLSALRNARKTVLRQGDAAERQRLEGARLLDRALARMDQSAEPGLVEQLKPLGEITRTPVGSRLKLGAALTMPIALRNRIAHDIPTDPDWWSRAAAALRPLVAYCAQEAPMRVLPPAAEHPSPWFLSVDGQVLAFNGMERDFAVLYVSPAGVSHAAADRTGEVLLAFGRLLGRAEEQEKDFRSLLSKLAPEEIRGVMMGDWLVGPPVGEGGFARVHVGRQLSTGRKVAIKILHDGMEPETVARFQQEASFLSRFRHPNIVGVYGFGQEAWSAPRSFSLSGEPWFDAFAKTAPVKTFIAMEWIEGRTLDDVFRAARSTGEGEPDLATCARWMADAANALSAVHAAGLIHRDIKPHNLMVAPGGTGGDEPLSAWQVKLMDFGIARVQKAERTLVTESGRTLGTPAYMAPEQIRAGDAEAEVGPQADVYSLCATFYELVTRRRLFEHDRVTIEEVKTIKTSGRRVPRPTLVVRNLPWEVETILLGGLEPEPADRYRSMDALERDVRHFLADEPIEYRRPSLARRGRLVYRRNRLVCNLVAVFVVLAAGGIAAYVQSIAAEQRRTAEQRDRAVHNEVVADRQRQIAQARERDARLALAGFQNGSGHALLEKGDPAAALLWYVRSLPLSADLPEEDRLSRLRIGVTLRQLPRPVQMWDYGLSPRQAVFRGALSRDGRMLVTAEAWGGDGGLENLKGGVRRIEVATGKAIGQPIPHDAVVHAVGFSHDNRRFVTASQDGVTRVFGAASGEPVAAPLRHEGGVGRAELNADGGRLLTSTGENRVVSVWEVDAGRTIFPPLTFERPIAAADISPDGSRLVVAVPVPTAPPDATHADVELRTYDAATGRPVSPVFVVPSFWGAEFSPDGRRLVVASGDSWARVYDAETGQPVAPAMTHTGPVTRAVFSLDGSHVATVSGDCTARLWNADTGKAETLPMPHVEAPFAVSFNAAGTRLATVSFDKTLRVWDAESGRALGPPARQTAQVLDGGFVAGNDDQVFLATQSGAVTWDFSRSSDPGVLRMEADRDVTATVFSDDSLRLAGLSARGAVRVIDLAAGREVLSPLPHPAAVVDVRFSPDGRRVLTACKDGSARVWEIPSAVDRAPAEGTAPGAAARAPLLVLPHAGPVTAARFSPDGSLIATASEDRTARVWDARTGQAVCPPLVHEDVVRDVCFDPDGRRLATAGADRTARVWDAMTGAAVGPAMKHDSGVTRVRYRLGGNRQAGPEASATQPAVAGDLLTAEEGGDMHLWDSATGGHVAVVNYGDVVQEVSFSRDGRRLLAAGFGNAVKVYDAAAPQQPTAVLHSGSFSAFACFSADGTLVFTSSFAGRRLWDVSGAPVGPILQPLPLGSGAFSPDGRWLATSDSKIRTWDVTPDQRNAADLEQLASLLAGRSLDARGVMTALSFEESLSRYEALQKQYPDDLSPRSPPPVPPRLSDSRPSPAATGTSRAD